MRIALLAALLTLPLAGCDVVIPNGLFGCGQQTDCPSGYHCWASDSRCYDAVEPACQPRSCGQIIADFESLGISIECGSLPDGCEGSIECGECPAGTECGANGQNFECGCEELTCATVGEGAECGTVQTRCEGSPGTIDCGDCFGQQVCQSNRCICPPGVNCDAGCGNCGDGEVCVEGECCKPTFPCAQNECSPPGGLDDGCGGTAVCPPCGDEEQCVLSEESFTFECLGDCTCEAQGVECGSAVICNQPTLCGTCQDNGYDEGFRCASGRCVCADPYEPNNQIDDAALVCSDPTCLQEAWQVVVSGTIHGTSDTDYFGLQILDADTILASELLVGGGDYKLFMTYICPNGEPGMVGCTGATEVFDGLKYCTSADRSVGISRLCPSIGAEEIGTLVVGVQTKEFLGVCEPYDLNVFATYGISGVN